MVGGSGGDTTMMDGFEQPSSPHPGGSEPVEDTGPFQACGSWRGAEASQPREPEGAESKPNSSANRLRRAPYTRVFRGFLEELGESPREFDVFRHKLWDDFNPEGAPHGLASANWPVGRGSLGRPKGRPPSMGDSACEPLRGYSYGRTEKINRGS